MGNENENQKKINLGFKGELISQGAEAKLYKKDNYVYKERVPKAYRHEIIDNRLRSSRTKRELKVLQKLKDLNVPVPSAEQENDFVIKMEFIEGERLRDRLLAKPEETKKQLIVLGGYIAKMHDKGIIHGDLTTSNVLITLRDELKVIDFGLSFFSDKLEDKAVDIHLFKQAIESTHYQHTEEFYEEFLKGYKESEEAEPVLKRLEEVEKRGRNKH